MKKLIIRLLIVLVAVYVLLSLLDFKGEYSAERSLWHINQQMNLLEQEPEAVPDFTFEQIIRRYRDFIKAYSHSPLVPQAYMWIAKVDLVRKNYDAARKVYAEIPAAFPHDPQHIAEAMAAIGETYEVQKDWPQAQEQYQKTIRLYPTTVVGLKLPLYIASRQAQNDPADKSEAFGRAITQYKNVLEHSRDKEIRTAALKLMVSADLARQDWPQVVKYCREMLMADADERSLREAIYVINVAAIVHMKNYDLPVEIYKEFMKKYPQHPMIGLFKGMVVNITRLKTNHVKITPRQEGK
ncbi:MAG: tetratricopeptide repeat protein [Candidatus Omnitrophica bacterium]|nr:tetratricopeptide repeat protein [Candidatus Omnitrophota bacterium]MDE2232374.1 tetratricopeptide repeat protein [Candidatus Omnitrophota bacterium]